MYVFFISQPDQHKSKPKNTIKAEKKKAVKNDISYASNTLYRYNKVIILCTHAHCILKIIKHKQKKRQNRQT